MKRIAMIKNNIVENIAIWDGVSLWSPPGVLLVDVTNIICDVGYVYDPGLKTFSPSQDLPDLNEDPILIDLENRIEDLESKTSDLDQNIQQVAAATGVIITDPVKTVPKGP